MKGNDVDKSIKNAFDYILQVYKETSFFLQDLEKELVNYNFYCINESNQTGTNFSHLLSNPNLWLTRYLTRFWLPKQVAGNWKGRKILYLSGSVIFISNDQGREPLFTYGVFQTMDSDAACFQFDWHLKVLQNEGGYFSYIRNGEKGLLNEVPPDRKPALFKCKLLDESYAWPKQGVIVVLPLTSIGDSKGISLLAKEMKDLWEERNAFCNFNIKSATKYNFVTETLIII